MSERTSKQQAAAAHLKSIVGAHLPQRCVRYSWTTICGELNANALGFQLDEQPVTGKVIAVTPEWVTLKMAQTKFAVIHTSVLKDPSSIGGVGAKVRVVPYASPLRRLAPRFAPAVHCRSNVHNDPAR